MSALKTPSVYQKISQCDRARGSLSLRKNGEIVHDASGWTPGLSQLDRICRITPAFLGLRLTRLSRNQIRIHWTKRNGVIHMETIRARPGLEFGKFQQMFEALDQIGTEMRARMLKTFAINPRLFKILEGTGWNTDELDEDAATENLRTFCKPVKQT